MTKINPADLDPNATEYIGKPLSHNDLIAEAFGQLFDDWLGNKRAQDWVARNGGPQAVLENIRKQGWHLDMLEAMLELQIKAGE